MIRRLHLCSSLLALSCLAAGLVRGQVNLSTYAGGTLGYADGNSRDAALNYPNDIAAGRDGTLYVADTGNHVIRKISSTGVVSTLAGAALESGAIDGVGSAARFKSPYGVVACSSGTVYVSDSGNHCIRKIDSKGETTLLAGAFSSAAYKDGNVTDARFDTPYGVAVDANGTLYVADSGNQVIRSIDRSGNVATVAGVPGTPGFMDGTAHSAQFNTPTGVAVDSAGNLFVSDFGNAAVRRIGADGVVTTLWSSKSPIIGAVSPAGIACDAFGNLFIADTTSSTIVRIGKDGAVCLVAGKNGVSGNQDGTTTECRLKNPGGLAMSTDGTLYIADTGNATIRKGVLTTFFNNALTANTPVTSSVIVGSNVTFGVNSQGEGFEYSWTKDDVLLAKGSPLFELKNVTSNTAGHYKLTVTDGFGATQSLVFTLIVAPPKTPATDTKLANLSTRAHVGLNGNVAIAGFAIRGGPSKTVLLRAVGPTLKERFNVVDALNSPAITVYQGQVSLASNAGWNDSLEVADAAQKTGAFAFSAGSKDAALLLSLPEGNYTAIIEGVNGDAGTALLEVYDADLGASTSEIVNLSSRSLVGGNAGVVIAGFVITGTQAKQVLVRASGAALYDLLGMSGTLAAPRLRLYSGQEVISENTAWDAGTNKEQIIEAATNAGAFAYLPGSHDATLLVTLQPGNYTAQVTGENDSQGISLIEIYDVK